MIKCICSNTIIIIIVIESLNHLSHDKECMHHHNCNCNNNYEMNIMNNNKREELNVNVFEDQNDNEMKEDFLIGSFSEIIKSDMPMDDNISKTWLTGIERMNSDLKMSL